MKFLFIGFGSFKSCNPSSIVPSSWSDLIEKDNEKSITDQKETFERISNFLKLSRRENNQDESAPRRHSKKKTTTIKQLFTAASKFQKNLKRGIYLACVCYSDDKVLVTNEDFIPVIEIDDAYPNSLNTDFYWLMKVCSKFLFFVISQYNVRYNFFLDINVMGLCKGFKRRYGNECFNKSAISVQNFKCNISNANGSWINRLGTVLLQTFKGQRRNCRSCLHAQYQGKVIKFNDLLEISLLIFL